MLNKSHTNSLLSYVISNRFFYQIYELSDETKKTNYKDNIVSIVKSAFNAEMVMKGCKSFDLCFKNSIFLVN